MPVDKHFLWLGPRSVNINKSPPLCYLSLLFITHFSFSFAASQIYYRRALSGNVFLEEFQMGHSATRQFDFIQQKMRFLQKLFFTRSATKQKNADLISSK